MVSFFAEVKISRFWPKTMDYNKAFWPKSRSFLAVFLLLTGRCYEAEICTNLLLLRCSVRWYPFLPKSKFPDFGRKPWTIIRRFDQNRGHSLRPFYSSLEGAMKLKFVPSAPIEMLCPMVSFFAEVKISDFGRKPWTIIRRFGRNRGHSLRPFYSSLEGAMKLKFVPFCSY